MTGRAMWCCHLETSNFRFEGFGETHIGALASIRAAARAHAEQYQITDPDEFLSWFDDPEQLNMRLVIARTGYRDGEPIAVLP